MDWGSQMGIVLELPTEVFFFFIKKKEKRKKRKKKKKRGIERGGVCVCGT